MREIPGHRGTACGAPAAYLHEEYRFADAAAHILETESDLFPFGFHVFKRCNLRNAAVFGHRGYGIVGRGSDIIYRVIPFRGLLLAVVRIVNEFSVIEFLNGVDRTAPFFFLALGTEHFAAEAEHLAAGILRDLRLMQQIRSVVLKPLRPVFILAEHVEVREIDIRAPYAVSRVYHRLQADLDIV